MTAAAQTPIEHRVLGRTGLSVSVLGYGGAEIGFEQAEQARVDRLLSAALDAGLNVIDTGECYLASEELIGAAVADRRDRYHLFTKVGHASGLPYQDWDPRLIRPSIERSLKRLRTDRLDLVQLHSCGEAVLRQGDVVAELRRARDDGLCRFIGYSGDGVAALHAVTSGAFDTLQISVSVADQEAIDLVLPEARARGMGVIAKRPIANAAWRHGRKPDNAYHHTYWERLQRLRYPFLEGDPEQAVSTALRFTLAQPGIHTAIVGTANPERWAANARLLQAGPLDAAQVAEICSHWKRHAGPHWGGQT